MYYKNERSVSYRPTDKQTYFKTYLLKKVNHRGAPLLKSISLMTQLDLCVSRSFIFVFVRNQQVYNP